MNALIVNCSPVKTGATAEIVKIIAGELTRKYKTKAVCIDDYEFSFCKGCRSCHKTARCVIDDDVPLLLDEFERADVIVCVSPSYWADVPGQFKAFIDRCTPWCNTNEPHASNKPRQKGILRCASYRSEHEGVWQDNRDDRAFLRSPRDRVLHKPRALLGRIQRKRRAEKSRDNGVLRQDTRKISPQHILHRRFWGLYLINIGRNFTNLKFFH